MRLMVFEYFNTTKLSPEEIMRPRLDQLWAYRVSGMVRDVFRLAEGRGVVYMLETAGLDEAREIIGSLILNTGLPSTFEFYILNEYRGWQRLFHCDDKEVKDRLNSPLPILSNGPKQFVLGIARFNENFTGEAYARLAKEQSIAAWRLYMSGVLTEISAIPAPLGVYVKLLVKDVEEAKEYFKVFPFDEAGMITWTFFQIQPFDFWIMLM
ncbi:11308_t:CDS:2 [Paraglomus occultum]|uniref:11308_t:CDS:1 n=1 Tax=Paraglomus occultum TaxID=144539 RepID=A0A9N8W4B4_9GLOM|nr:11308_t:CDS:2 [Paraglomus occultum]